MNTANHIAPEDLPLIALQFLPEQEMADALVHLEHCEACRAEIARYQGDLATYALTSEMHSPPALARERLMRRVAKEKKVIPIERPQPVTTAAHPDEPVLAPRRGSGMFDVETYEEPRRSRSAGIAAWSGWAIAAGLAVVAGLLYKDTGALRATIAANSHQVAGLTAEAARSHQLTQALTDPKAMRVTLTTKPVAKPKPEPIAGATYHADKGTLVFLASGLDPLETYKTYELWLIPADGTAPVPAGTFHPDDHGNASLIMPDLPKGVAAKGFGVTIEDEGGSQTPTQPIIMAGF